MTNRRKACVVVFLALAALAAGAPGVSAEELTREEVLVRELLEVSGMTEMMNQIMVQMVEGLEAATGETSDEFWDEFLAQVDPKELEEQIIPIYLRHFTAEELEATLAFYRSPAGQSILQKMPVVLQESMAAGQQWGMEVSRKAIEQLEVREEAEEGKQKGKENEK